VIVADTNLIAYLLIPRPFPAEAERVQAQDPDSRVPWLWRSEFLNVLSLYVRTVKMTLAVLMAHEHALAGCCGLVVHRSARNANQGVLTPRALTLHPNRQGM
jgi:hypothetical protein